MQSMSFLTAIESFKIRLFQEISFYIIFSNIWRIQEFDGSLIIQDMLFISLFSLNDEVSIPVEFTIKIKEV